MCVVAQHLTKAEVAQRARVSQRTVDRWMRRRLIPYHKLGSRVRFAEADVTTFFEHRKIPAVTLSPSP